MIGLHDMVIIRMNAPYHWNQIMIYFDWFVFFYDSHRKHCYPPVIAPHTLVPSHARGRACISYFHGHTHRFFPFLQCINSPSLSFSIFPLIEVESCLNQDEEGDHGDGVHSDSARHGMQGEGPDDDDGGTYAAVSTPDYCLLLLFFY